jgi:hypothetical protein
MNYDKYILVDYNNIQNINIDIIDEKTKMIIIIGENQKIVPIDLIQKTQAYGNAIEWLKIKNNGNKSLLDFFIACFLGYFISNQGNKEFIIFSKNKDYDPLIEYLQNNNINVKRIEGFKQNNKKNSFIRKTLDYISSFWRKFSVTWKICFSAIVIAVIVGIIVVFRLSSALVLVAVYDKPITDKNILNRIVTRISQENVKVTVTPDNIVRVADDATARRMRVILIHENLIPSGIAPWQVFDKERWTITDMERNINFQRAQEKMIADHIRAIEGIDNIELSVMWSKVELFVSEQKPASASVLIFPTPGSDISQNRKKIEDIHKIIKLFIEGIKDENIVITDQSGLVLNDFDGVIE